MLTPTIDTFGLAEEKRIQEGTDAILAQFREDVDDLICRHLESISDCRARIILADYFADFLEDAFGATDDADTLRSEERVAYQDAITDEEEREAVRRHPW